jgi:hypothetical protein
VQSRGWVFIYHPVLCASPLVILQTRSHDDLWSGVAEFSVAEDVVDSSFIKREKNSLDSGFQE